MEAKDLDRKGLLKESRRLIINVGNRITNVRQYLKSVNGVMNDAVKQYNILMRKTPKVISTLTDRELRTLYRQLVYIDNLKTSTVKGVAEAETNYSSIRDRLKMSPKSTQKTFWNAYQKLVEENGYLVNFKYEIMDLVADMAVSRGEDYIVDFVKELHDTVYEKYAHYDEELYKDKFISKLRNV